MKYQTETLNAITVSFLDILWCHVLFSSHFLKEMFPQFYSDIEYVYSYFQLYLLSAICVVYIILNFASRYKNLYIFIHIANIVDTSLFDFFNYLISIPELSLVQNNIGNGRHGVVCLLRNFTTKEMLPISNSTLRWINVRYVLVDKS